MTSVSRPQITNGLASWPYLAGLFVLAAIYTAARFFLGLHGITTSEHAAALWRLEFALLLAVWVRMDRRRYAFTGPFEFDAFVFFAWPVAVPYYLYKTRGRIGLLFALLLCLLAAIPGIVGDIFRLVPLR